MEDTRTPEQRFFAERTVIGEMIDNLLTQACGERPAFMLLFTFQHGQVNDLGAPGLAMGNIGPESMQVLAQNFISNMVPQARGGH